MKLVIYLFAIIPFVFCCEANDKCIKLKKLDYQLNGASESEFLLGNYTKAIALCNDIINDNPENYIAFLNRGTIKHNECLTKVHMSEEDKISIYADIKHSFSLCPDFSLGYRNLIAVAHDIEDFNTVIIYSELYFSKFGENKHLPHYSKVLTRYSFALHATGKIREALKYSNEAIQVQPVDTFAYLVRGKCYRELGHYDEAIDDFDTAMTLDTGFFLAYTERAYCLKLLDRFSEAESYYLKALAIDSNRAESYWGLGIMKVEIGDTMSGCQLYNKALLMNRSGSNLISYINEEIMKGEIEKICQ